MTDRIRTAWATIEQLSAQLAIRALDDQAAAAYPTTSGGPNVTASGTSDPTGRTVRTRPDGSTLFQLEQARDYQLACRILEQAATMLQRGWERMTPQATGEDCPTATRDHDTGELVRCTGEVTHRGRCEECDRDWRVHRGFEVPVDVVKARNARRPRWCDCPPSCCDPCTDRAAEGRTKSERCKRRLTRARQVERALTDPAPSAK